ncbi:MAG TPA: hypothetical protein VG944_13635 [Fimbriimonas sp.]|nr:hypothetical protein [Fimbriimonas sp.]
MYPRSAPTTSPRNYADSIAILACLVVFGALAAMFMPHHFSVDRNVKGARARSDEAALDGDRSGPNR